DGIDLSIARDPASPKVPGDGTARGLNTTVTSGPADNWITPDGAYLYQIYGNAAKLVGYATQPDGSLKDCASVPIPYNSPQGLAGFGGGCTGGGARAPVVLEERAATES